MGACKGCLFSGICFQYLERQTMDEPCHLFEDRNKYECVIRCEKCAYFREYDAHCRFLHRCVKPDGFCSYAESNSE